jgi:hypothetical protein
LTSFPKDNSKLEAELEELYPMLSTIKVRSDDPEATQDALIKLFKITQLAME